MNAAGIKSTTFRDLYLPLMGVMAIRPTEKSAVDCIILYRGDRTKLKGRGPSQREEDILKGRGQAERSIQAGRRRQAGYKRTSGMEEDKWDEIR